MSMIMNGPVPPERQAASKYNYKIFALINGLSYMCLGETVIILLAVQLNCKDYIVSALGAMLYFGFLLLPLGKIVTAHVGAAQSQGIFWILRNISALIVAAATPVCIYVSPTLAVIILLAGAFLFYGFRAAGTVMVQPLLGEMTNRSDRSAFIALTTALFYATCFIALVAISIVLHYTRSIWALTGIIIIGAMFGFTSSRFISRIDETGAIRDSAKKPIMGELKILCRSNPVLRLLAGGFVINLAVIMLIPISMLALKRGYGISNTNALMFALVQMAASVLLSYVIVKATRKLGPRRIMIVTYLFMLLIGLLWMLAPAKFNWLYLIFPFILCGGTYVSMTNSMIHYFLQIVEEERRVAASILIAIVTGAGAGIAGMLIAGGLLAAIERLTDKLQSPDPYKVYFIAATILLLPGLCVLSSMKPLPVEKRMIRKTWFDFLW